jgi:hypothetical protein
MSAISTTGARIVRLDNVRPARRGHVRRIEAPKLERSSQYQYLEASITSISKPHDLPDRFFAPYRRHTVGEIFVGPDVRDLAHGLRLRSAVMPRLLKATTVKVPSRSAASFFALAINEFTEANASACTSSMLPEPSSSKRTCVVMEVLGVFAALSATSF